MKVVFHPEFPRDQRRYEADYAEISAGLAQRFRQEIDEAITSISAAPGTAGHLVNTGSMVVAEFRRRNLEAFPFFVLYGWTGDTLFYRTHPHRSAALADTLSRAVMAFPGPVACSRRSSLLEGDSETAPAVPAQPAA